MSQLVTKLPRLFPLIALKQQKCVYTLTKLNRCNSHKSKVKMKNNKTTAGCISPVQAMQAMSQKQSAARANFKGDSSACQ